MDNIDRALIRALKADSRASWADLGQRVGLSASAARRRVDRLCADGVIQSFTITVDPTFDGKATEAYVELFCRGTVSPQDLRRILLAVPEVAEASTVTGEADAIVRIRADGVAALEESLEKVRATASVDHTRSAIVLSPLIRRQD